LFIYNKIRRYGSLIAVSLLSAQLASCIVINYPKKDIENKATDRDSHTDTEVADTSGESFTEDQTENTEDIDYPPYDEYFELVAETVPLPYLETVSYPETKEPQTEEITEVQTEELPPEDIVSPLIAELKKIEEDYQGAVLEPTEDGGSEYIDRIIFLGDSTTYGLYRYGMLSDGTKTTQVWTPKSGTLTLSLASYTTILYPEDKTEITIAEAVARSKPDIMVVTLGINGVSFMKESYFKSEYGKLVDIIKENSPDTKIILQSIFPVAASYANQISINNDKITAANKWIASVAEEKGVKYANTITALIGDDGYLPEALQNGDGLHLNSTGFDIELNYLRTHLYPEIKEEPTPEPSVTESEIHTEEVTDVETEPETEAETKKFVP